MRQAKVKPAFKNDQKDSKVTEIYRYSDFLAPRFWSVWAAIAGLHLLAWMPWRLKVALSHGLSRLTKRFAKSRYRTLRRNIEVCFPDLPEAERETLIEKALFSNVFGILETAHAWCRGTQGLKIEVEGLEHYQAALKDGRGILFLSAHFSMLDMGAAIFGTQIKAGTIYRKHDNPLFNYFMTRSRESYVTYTLARKDVKGMIQRLKNGDGLAYLPDQDFGKKRSIFVPFFGVPTATITMTSKLVEASNAQIIPISAYRKGESNEYGLVIHPPMVLSTTDEEADTLVWTRWLEDCIKQHPEQYLWFHKRFKTRPEGEPSIY